jgi:hypothetical protein
VTQYRPDPGCQAAQRLADTQAIPWKHKPRHLRDKPSKPRRSPGRQSSPYRVTPLVQHHSGMAQQALPGGDCGAGCRSRPGLAAVTWASWLAPVGHRVRLRICVPRGRSVRLPDPRRVPGRLGVWLTPDDVAPGKDTVVEAAPRWIHTRCSGRQDRNPSPAAADPTKGDSTGRCSGRPGRRVCAW